MRVQVKSFGAAELCGCSVRPGGDGGVAGNEAQKILSARRSQRAPVCPRRTGIIALRASSARLELSSAINFIRSSGGPTTFFLPKNRVSLPTEPSNPRKCPPTPTPPLPLSKLRLPASPSLSPPACARMVSFHFFSSLPAGATQLADSTGCRQAMAPAQESLPPQRRPELVREAHCGPQGPRRRQGQGEGNEGRQGERETGVWHFSHHRCMQLTCHPTTVTHPVDQGQAREKGRA